MARRKKIPACEAKRRLETDGINFDADFFELRSSEVNKVLDMAKAARYYKSKNAPGSRARMYYQYLKRSRCGR